MIYERTLALLCEFMFRSFYISTSKLSSVIISGMANKNDMGTSPHQNKSYEGEKLIYPAASRNKDPILQVLKRFVVSPNNTIDDTSPLFLEIASGSGQHLAHFATYFPGIKFQPSEFDTGVLGSICYYAAECKTKNICQPLHIDVCTKLGHYGFSEHSISYMYCANMMHISPYKCTVGLFENAGAYLKPNGLLITYGPYGLNGLITPQSNIDFDASLRGRDSSWGIRDICDLEKLAKLNYITLIEIIDMPSNNKTLIWKRNEIPK